jgi:acyl-CoA synthetase (AMP-forming)/AMP-acid ligase II
MYGGVTRVFDRAVRHYSDRIAVIEGDRSLSYAELGAAANRVANGLVRIGASAETPVGMLMPNSMEFVTTIYGIWKSGASYMQMSALGGPRDFMHNLNLVGARVLVYHSRYDEVIDLVRTEVPAVHTFIRFAADHSEPPEGVLDYDDLFGGQPTDWAGALPDPSAIASIMFTSGTTGDPKAVLIDHLAWSHFMITNAFAVCALEEGCRFLHIAPMSHLSISFILPTLMRGGINVILDGFDVDAFLESVSSHRATATAVVPTIIYSLLDHPGTRDADLTSLQTVVYAGSPISPARLKQALDVLGPCLTQYYGGIEQGALSCLRKEDHTLESAESIARLSSAGRILYHVEIRIVDTEDQEVPVGVAGEICSRAPGQMTRYSDPEKTAEAVRDGWLHTGDIGYLDENGFLFIVDRKKEMLISGGMNVFPRQIEDLLSEHPAVRESAVFGIPDERWGEAVKAVIVLEPGREATFDELREYVKLRKGSSYAPKSIDFVDAIPRTAVGKVDKRTMKAPYWEGHDRSVN